MSLEKLLAINDKLGSSPSKFKAFASEVYSIQSRPSSSTGKNSVSMKDWSTYQVNGPTI
jgi:hypothetical protein